MENAKQEFLDHVQTRQVLCALIRLGPEYFPEECKHVHLPHGYSQNSFEQFLHELDFEYDDGYGGQELFGTIWYADGTWSERGEYDGSEWWEHKLCPRIPDELIQRPIES